MNGSTMDSCLRWEDVLKLVPVSKRELQRRISAHQFPHPRKLGRRSIFIASEIRDFIDNLKAQPPR